MRALMVVLVLTTACSDYGFNSRTRGNDRDGDETDVDPDSTGTDVSDEDCNGIDDDGDGEIDEGWPDVDGDGVADCVDDACDVEAPPAIDVKIDEDCLLPAAEVIDPWNVRIEWQWTGLLRDKAVHNVIMTPVIGNLTDTDGDGDVDTDDVPNVVFAAFAGSGLTNGTLVVLDGRDGRELWSKPGWHGSGGIALADIDSDGLTDIVGFDTQARPMAADRTGKIMWTGPNRVGTGYPQATVADIDGDGSVEVIADNIVLDGKTGAELFVLKLNPGIPYRLPAVGDLDQDGDQELILGNQVFDHTGRELWSSSVVGGYGHWSAIFDQDGDPQAEVAMIGGGRLAIYDHDGTQKVLVNAGTAQPGAPCVADFNGDGAAEIAWASSNLVNMFTLEGKLVWSATVNDSSGLASCSGYDIDGDGQYELLFADQNTFRIYDGASGTVLFQQAGHASGTLWEYPSVADVDGDGSAEIVIGSNNYSFTGWGGITVFGHAGDGWMRSGSTWHTHDFAVTNINADGSVPARPIPWWQIHNVYRARPADDGSATDLQAFIIDVCFSGCEAESLVQVSVQVGNMGQTDAATGVPVSLYARDGALLELIETKRIVGPVRAGRTVDALVFDIAASQVAKDGLVVRVDDDGTRNGEYVECDEDNNEGYWSDSPCE